MLQLVKVSWKNKLALTISDRKYNQNTTCPYLDDRYTPWSRECNPAHRFCTPVTQRQKTFTPPELHLASDILGLEV